MVVVKLEVWPHGDQSKAYPLGEIQIANDGTGNEVAGNYEVLAKHAGMYYGKRPEPFKRGRVTGFHRKLSPYRLLCRALQAICET